MLLLTDRGCSRPLDGTMWLAVEGPHPREVTTVWAKISTSATSMACAACLVAAATLPAAGTAAEQLARTAGVNLAVDFSRLAAFDAIPFLLAGDLSGLASTSAIPAYLDLLGGDIDATGGLDSVSAIRTFFGSDGVFGTGGIDALLPNETTGQPGYAPFSRRVPAALRIGSAGLLTGGGVDALAHDDALSAIPVFVGTDGVFDRRGCGRAGRLGFVERRTGFRRNRWRVDRRGCGRAGRLGFVERRTGFRRTK